MASPSLGKPWDMYNISLVALPSRDKPSYSILELSIGEDNILSDLRINYSGDHTMLRPLVGSEEALYFFGLKPGTPWTPAMGNDLLVLGPTLLF